MKENIDEYQIGNCIKYDRGLWTGIINMIIKTDEKNIYQLKNGNELLRKDIEPIYLDSELLKSLGFTTQENNVFYRDGQKIKFMGKKELAETKTGLRFSEYFAIELGSELLEITTLHSLQNYWKTELEIDLDLSIFLKDL